MHPTSLAASGGPPSLAVMGLIGRIVLAAVLGGLIGFEREFREQPAGLRTHLLVSLGAALFTMAGAYGVAGFVGSGGVSFDPTRIAAQVVTGIGFLGAGAILTHGLTVRGLTTAAALWVTAAIGLAVGLGYLWGATITTAATLAALVGLKQVEAALIPRMKRGRHECLIEMGPELRIADLGAIVDTHGAEILSMKLSSESSGKRELVLSISTPTKAEAEAIPLELSTVEGVTALDWT
jgi:putative Mg2+ transporter-C (MgtC) family protein